MSTTLGCLALWLGLKASGTLGSGAAWCGSIDDSCTVLAFGVGICIGGILGGGKIEGGGVDGVLSFK